MTHPSSTNAAPTARDAIARSVSHTEIVVIECDTRNDETDVCNAMAAACEDSAESDVAWEYWGTTDAGSDWRVNVQRISE